MEINEWKWKIIEYGKELFLRKSKKSRINRWHSEHEQIKILRFKKRGTIRFTKNNCKL